MKKLTALLLALAMVFSLAACSNTGSGEMDNKGGSGSTGNPDNSSSQGGGEKQDDIVLWTLSNDLKQFAERYEEQTGNHVEVVVFDSADFETKIMQTLGAKSKDLDVFVGEPQMLPNFYEAGFCADLSALDSEVKTRLVDYTYEAGCDEDGVLRAISYQACPGSVIYRRDLAKEVFGTDDPDEIAKHFSSFEEIEKTSDTLQAKGYCVFGDEGALRWFSNRDPWVKDGQIIINQDRLDYMDCATHLYQNDQVAYALEWSAPWYASMAGPLPKISEAQSGDVWGMDKDQLISEGAAGGEGLTQVFSYVMPSWGALIVRDNAEGNKGNFGVCSGPCAFFGGGTFLTVNEFSQHKEAAQKFIEFCTLNDETSQWWLEASNGDVVNNKAVLDANSDYQNESFGNQNTYAFYLAEMEKIDFNLTGYDDACKDAWGKAITAVKKGEQTKEEAVQEFYQNVITQFPELSVPADSPYYNG